MLAKESHLPFIFPAWISPALFHDDTNFFGTGTMLQVTHLTIQFDHAPILSRFNLSLAPGEFKVLVGPSGCGKSSFLDGLTGVTTPREGEIRWQGESLPHLGGKAAYMQQKDLLLPWADLLDNALLPARAAGRSIKAAREEARSYFQRLGLAGYEHHLPRQVSGGMRQRCALARTLMFDRELILLDEPLSALDAITRRSLQSLLLLLQTEFKKTLLMITHDIEEALILADEVCLLSSRPMEIRETFVLDSPKPRDFTDPKLMEIKAHVLDQLQRDQLQREAGHV